MAATLVAVLVVAAPELFTRNGFAVDFTNHLWLVGVQERSIAHHLTPTFFMNTQYDGVFYPFFMFYGGTVYAIGGALAALFGGAIIVAYVLVSVAAIAAAYGGMLWLARQFGVRSWAAHAPAITFVASAYYVTNVYGRGAWPEFVATSMIPLVVASGWRLLTGRLRGGPAALFLASFALFAGSHNITLVLGTVFLLLTTAVLLASQGLSVVPPLRRIALLLGLVFLGLALDAWFLLPDLAYQSRTAVSTIPEAVATAFLDTPGLLFDPLRSVPKASSTPALFVQVPVMFLAWALIVLAIQTRRSRPRLGRAAVALAALLAAEFVAITSAPIWDALPKIIRDAQFPYRLNTYVALLIAGLVIIGALMVQDSPVQRRRRLMYAGLGLATLWSVALCVWQLWIPNTRFPNSYRDVDQVFVSPHAVPKSWYAGPDYSDVSLAVVGVGAGRVLTINPTSINADDVRLRVTPPAGTAPFETNIDGGPYAVAVSGGVHEVGRTAAGQMVLARNRPGNGAVGITMRTARGAAVVAGRILSLIALALVVLLLLAWAALAIVRRSSGSRRGEG